MPDEYEEYEVDAPTEQQSSMGGYIPYDPKQSSSIIVLTNPEDELYQMELTLRSMVPDGKGNPLQVGRPLLNEKGIVSVLGLCRSIVNKNSIFSNFNEKEVNLLIMNLIDTICKDLMINRINYDIADGSRDTIVNIVLNNVYPCLKRGYQEGDKRFWKGTVQEIHSKTETGGNKGGAISRFFGWGGKQ